MAGTRLEDGTLLRIYGAEGQYAWAPVAVGFVAGCAFVYFADVLLPSPEAALAAVTSNASGGGPKDPSKTSDDEGDNAGDADMEDGTPSKSGALRSRVTGRKNSPGKRRRAASSASVAVTTDEARRKAASWRRIMLLVIAVTVHNFPEGLAVGVGVRESAVSRESF